MTREADPSAVIVSRLARMTETAASQLADVLVDCVEGGASVSFMLPLEHARAQDFWAAQAEDVATGARIILVAADDSGIVCTVQLILALPENQPHRADVAKMLVHRRARRKGIASKLMQALEGEARTASRSLLVLDTVTGSDAACLYERLGWQRAGDIPDFALFPAGGLTPTTFYYRQLAW